MKVEHMQPMIDIIERIEGGMLPYQAVKEVGGVEIRRNVLIVTKRMAGVIEGGK